MFVRADSAEPWLTFHHCPGDSSLCLEFHCYGTNSSVFAVDIDTEKAIRALFVLGLCWQQERLLSLFRAGAATHLGDNLLIAHIWYSKSL